MLINFYMHFTEFFSLVSLPLFFSEKSLNFQLKKKKKVICLLIHKKKTLSFTKPEILFEFLGLPL